MINERMVAPDLVVLSHLPWTWVWQRPQHLVSRLAAGRRTWYIEQPVRADVPAAVLHRDTLGPVHRVWMDVPHSYDRAGLPDFAPSLDPSGGVCPGFVGAGGGGGEVWLPPPRARALAENLAPGLLPYDMV